MKWKDDGEGAGTPQRARKSPLCEKDLALWAGIKCWDWEGDSPGEILFKEERAESLRCGTGTDKDFFLKPRVLCNAREDLRGVVWCGVGCCGVVCQRSSECWER